MLELDLGSIPTIHPDFIALQRFFVERNALWPTLTFYSRYNYHDKDLNLRQAITVLITGVIHLD